MDNENIHCIDLVDSCEGYLIKKGAPFNHSGLLRTPILNFVRYVYFS